VAPFKPLSFAPWMGTMEEIRWTEHQSLVLNIGI
jgi:hypothetical protein